VREIYIDLKIERQTEREREIDHHPNLGLRGQPFHLPESKSVQDIIKQT
jgi:hypothetical protein